MTDQTGYRFMLDENTGTITRGRAYRLPSDWTCDSWSHYFGEDTVAFYDEGWNRLRAYEGDWATNTADAERAMKAYSAEQDTLTRSEGALDRVAQRIAGNSEAGFICVNLDRGTDFYVMHWGHGQTDPVWQQEWRDEIEAVYHGDIWRIECEDFVPGFGVGGSDWVSSDEYPDEFYGEDKALIEFARIFPLTEFPAEVLVTSGD